MRRLQSRFALTTILSVAPFLAYGRHAYADCVASPASPTYLCSGSSTDTEIVAIVDNADVSTAVDFSVNAAAGQGLVITGAGDIRFTDNYATTSIVAPTNALVVTSTGDDGSTPGAVTILSSGAVTGGDNGIVAFNQGSGDIDITANGGVTGERFNGIFAFDIANSGSIAVTTGPDSAITGDDSGILVRHFGNGDIDITANGGVAGESQNGITAYNAGAGSDTPGNGVNLKIATGAGSEVTGGIYGIYADNDGSGYLAITANGYVHGEAGDAIYANNSSDGTYLTVTTGPGSEVRGNGDGIDANNYGGGDLNITVNGTVVGTISNGIEAYNDANGDNLFIETGAGSLVEGRSFGIDARNYGSANLEITARGDVEGTNTTAIGIAARNSSSGIDLKITTGADTSVTGGYDGIYARNYGRDLIITVDGTITGTARHGIRAYNSDNEAEELYGRNLKITTEAASTITGGQNGILADNHGTGYLAIAVNGTVTGQASEGIFAYNSSHGSYLEITTGANSSVTGARNGINARNSGEGDLTITTQGSVSGGTDNGIFAENTGNGEDLIITTGAAGAVTGELWGINAISDAAGYLSITANGHVGGTTRDGIYALNNGEGNTYLAVGREGLVEGNTAGIYARSLDGQTISITNDGLVRNLSVESDDRAILARGGAVTIDNNGSLIGTVWTGNFTDTLNNAGTWNIHGGITDFGGAFDGDVVNNSGTIIAGEAANVDALTIIDNLERMNNSGLLTLVDGGEGDILNLAAAPGPILYEGNNGRLAVDAVLGPTGESDKLDISGNTSGKTLITVNVIDVTGVNTVGIPVVRVFDGTTAEEHFDLAGGALNIGFLAWDLRMDDGGQNWHELFTSGAGAGSYEFAAGIGGAQEVWHQTMGTIHQRQADLRVLLEGIGVTPVADYAEPIAPTPVANITPGFWFRGVGAWLERDDEEDGFTLDRKQTVWGGMAGFDFGHENANSAWLFGGFGGYLTSDLEFDETNTEWTYEGPTVGAYVTYLDHGFYADLTVKADFLDIEIDPEDLAPASDDADTDATNIGGRIDTGYKFGSTVFIEPQASLAVVHTEIDDVEIFGGDVEFDDETSVRGRLGLRLGFDHTGATQVVYSGDVIASVWEEFAGDNDVSITDPAFGTFGASDDAGGTYGDVSVGFSVAAPEGWSGFIRGNYLFGDDYEAVTGNAGIRYAF